MAIFPLPPGLLARLNVPPPYVTASADTPPPAYIIAPLNRMSTFHPESIPLPPSPLTHHIPPPEYSPSVYSQQQRLSQYLPPTSEPADFGFPSSPRATSGGMQQQHHASQFKESWTDLEMRVDLENSTAAAAADVEENGAERVEGMGKKSVFRLYPPVGDGEVERLYWKRGVVGVGIGVVVVVVVAIVVAAGVYGRR